MRKLRYRVPFNEITDYSITDPRRCIPPGMVDPVPRGVADLKRDTAYSFKGCGEQKRDRCGRAWRVRRWREGDDRVARKR